MAVYFFITGSSKNAIFALACIPLLFILYFKMYYVFSENTKSGKIFNSLLLLFFPVFVIYLILNK